MFSALKTWLPGMLVATFPFMAAADPVRIIVGFHLPAGAAEEKLLTSLGGTVLEQLPLIRAFSAELPEEAVPGLRAHPAVRFVEREAPLSLPRLPPRPQTRAAAEEERSWALDRIKAELAHRQGITGAGVKIGIIDTGIDYHHPDLRENYGGGYDFINDDADPMDDSRPSHGTLVAGVIAAKADGRGILGVAPNASLYALKVMDAEGRSSVTHVVSALQWAVEHELDIVNISMGETDSIAFREACDAAFEAGVLLVAAAGNTERKAVDHPAAYGSVIAVGAIDEQDRVPDFSAMGEAMELTAPGTSIRTTLRNGRTGTASGTSLAAPHVTGVAALALSAGLSDLNHDGKTDNRDLRLRLLSATRDMGRPGVDSLFGYGAIDVGFLFQPRMVSLPDLSISLQATRNPVPREKWFDYLVTLHNTGDAPALESSLFLTLPPALTPFASPCGGKWESSESGRTLRCHFDRLDKGGSRTLTIRVKATAATSPIVTNATLHTPLERDMRDNVARIGTTLINGAPTAGETTLLVGLDQAGTTGNLLDSAWDPEGDPLVILSADNVSEAGGRVENHGDGTFTYHPPTGFLGSDRFHYVIGDGHGGTATGTVEIAVKVLLPIRIDGPSKPLGADERANFSITLTNPWTEPAETLSLNLFALFSPSGNSAISLKPTFTVDQRCQPLDIGAVCPIDSLDGNGGSITFRLEIAPPGPGELILNVSLLAEEDKIGATSETRLVMFPPPNTPPRARDDRAQTQEGKPLLLEPLANDSDADDDDLRIVEMDATSRAGGSLSMETNDRIRYHPVPGFHGEDRFRYTIEDDNGARASATVYITVEKSEGTSPPPAGGGGTISLLLSSALLSMSLWRRKRGNKHRPLAGRESPERKRHHTEQSSPEKQVLQIGALQRHAELLPERLRQGVELL